MRYSDDVDLDTSQVEDARGGGFGGRGLAVGGGGLGVVGLLVVLLFQFLGGGGSSSPSGNGSGVGGFGQIEQNSSTNGTQLAQECRKGSDANRSVECAVVADINSIQDFWAQQLGSRYTETDTVFFSGQVQTGCGNASAGTGPFYCPADKLVYIDLSFFDQLRNQFGAEGGAFVNAYVIAHEYGHHVQDLLGATSRGTLGTTGASSGSVRLELQADCYAGVWANHATTVPTESGKPLIAEITQDDVTRALDTAGRIGDDFIERNLGSGRVDPNSFTHGTSAQRQKWFTTGFRSGDPRQCDTFGTNNLG